MSLKTAVAKMLGITAPQFPGGWNFPVPTNQTGVPVSESTALTYAAVWRAVTLISRALASLPWRVMTDLPDGSKRHVPSHPADLLLDRRPNPETAAMPFLEAIIGHMLLWGNGYAEIERDGSRQPLAAWLVTPDRVRAVRSPDGGLWYEVRQPMGVAGPVFVPAADMLHFHGMGFDGMQGYSVVRMAAASLGLGLATERFGSAFFGNGAQVSGVLSHPSKPSEEARKNMRESWERAHQGTGNAMRTAVLYEGVEWKQIGIPPEDAQFLLTRQHQVVEVARWFGVPPHMLQHLEKTTVGNVEEQAVAYVRDTLAPWATSMEQEADLKLLSRPELFTRINLKGLLRGSAESRSNGYAVARNWGWLSVNEIRAFEDMDPIGPEGDVYLTPLNMIDAAAPAPVSPRAPPADGAPAPAQSGVTAALGVAASAAAERILAREAAKLQTVCALPLAVVSARLERFLDGHRSWCETVIEGVEAMGAAAGVDRRPCADSVSAHAERLLAWLRSSGGNISPHQVRNYAREEACLLAAEIQESFDGQESQA